MCNCKKFMDTTTTDTTAPAAAPSSAPYLALPWKFKRLDAASKDDSLKRYTFIFQSLAALVTVIVLVYGFTKASE